MPGRAPTIEIQPIPDDEKAVIEDKVTLACNARKTVYFEVADRKDINAPNANGGEVGTQTSEDGEDLSAGAGGALGEGWAAIFDQNEETEDTLTAVVVTPVEPPREVVEISAAAIRPNL